MSQQRAHLSVDQPTCPATEHRWCKIVCPDPLPSQHCQPTCATAAISEALASVDFPFYSLSRSCLSNIDKASSLHKQHLALRRPKATANASSSRAPVKVVRGNFSLRLFSSSLALPPPSYFLQIPYSASLLLRSSLSSAQKNATCAKDPTAA